MHTLKQVLKLVNGGEDIYCELYQGNSCICKGWLASGLTLNPDTKIESYRLNYDSLIKEYLVLHLA